MLLHELEQLAENNLIKGGDLNNAIVLVERKISQAEKLKLAKLFEKTDIKIQKQGILNNLELRFDNEPARHKLLDVIGDFTFRNAHKRTFKNTKTRPHRQCCIHKQIISDYEKNSTPS